MSKEEPLRRNSPAWAIDRFRSDALPKLLDDLAPVAETGIPEAECLRVKKALNQIIDDASELPDGGIFRRAIWQHLQDFHDLYSQWNDVKGKGDAPKARRDEIIREIRSCRNKIAKAARTNAHILNQELDLGLIDSFYSSLRALIETAPTLFVKLGEAVKRYFTRRGLSG